MNFKMILFLSMACLGTFCCCSEDNAPVPEPDPKPNPEEKPVVPPVSVDFPNGVVPHLEFGADGGKEQLQFYTTGEWKASLADGKGATDWISFSPASGGKGYCVVEVVAAATELMEARKAVLCVSTKDVKAEVPIVQAEKKVILTDKNEVKVEHLGGTFELAVKANVDYEVQLDADWISQQSSKAVAESRLVFVVDKNGRKEDRTAKLVLVATDKSVSQTITVTQLGKHSSADDWEEGHDDWWKPDAEH